MSSRDAQRAGDLRLDAAARPRAEAVSDPTPKMTKDFALAAIRVARARAQLLALEIDEIGVSLKHNMITAEFAMTWLGYIGALELINVEPFTNKMAVT